MSDVPKLSFGDLALQPGQPLQIELDCYMKERYKCSLVGYRNGHSIMVTAPAKRAASFTNLLDSKVKVRLFSSHLNGACAFETTLLHMAKQPYPYWHLAHPEQLVLGEVRKSIRAEVNVIASVVSKNQGEITKATVCIVDLSVEGARIASLSKDANFSDEITLVAKLKVGSIERIVQLKAIVRSRNVTEEKQFLGLQLIDLSDEDKILIHACVLSKLHKVPSLEHA